MLRQIIMYTIIAVFIGISQSAGVGGGPVLNICLMIGANYSAKQSMAITYIFLMGGACASIINNYKKIHPSDKTLVMDYNLIIITLPMIASGSLFGVIFEQSQTLSNHYLSELVITILFVILLSYLIFNTYTKIKKFNVINKQQIVSPLYNSVQLKEISKKQISNQLQVILEQQLNPLPKQKLVLSLIVYLYTIVILLTKGGHNYDSIISLPKCGIIGNILVFLHLCLGFYCSKKIGQKAIQFDSKKQSLGYNFKNQSDKMTEKKVWNCIISGFCAGLIGGTLGLGGAIVLVPVWLSSGIDQLRATGSSPPLIFFSALISFSICFLSGHYKSFMQLCFYFALAYVGSAGVKSVINIITQKYHLKTMVLILLILTLALSLFTLMPYQLFKFFNNPERFLQFGKFC